MNVKIAQILMTEPAFYVVFTLDSEIESHLMKVWHGRLCDIHTIFQSESLLTEGSVS